MRRRRKPPHPVSDPVMLALKRRMLLNAIHHTNELSTRTVVSLQRDGLLKDDRLKRVDAEDQHLQSVLSDDQHPLRIRLSAGPLVFWRDAADGQQRTVASATDAILFPDQKLRSAAISYLDVLSLAEPRVLTAASQHSLRTLRTQIMSFDPSVWRDAAVTLSDTLDDDWLLNLAGVRQSLEADFDVGTDDYLRRVLLPTVTSVQPINLHWWDPRKQRGEMEAQIDALASDSTDLGTVLSRYLGEFGHVPLMESLSMGRLLVTWMQKHDGRVEAIWQTIWSWADSNKNVFAAYHACQSFLYHPSLIPEGAAIQFWEHVASVVAASADDGTKNPGAVAWQLTCRLAQHFCRHFECSLPGKDSERITTLAWWLAARVAAELGSESNLAARAREHLLPALLGASAEIWHFARPFVLPSDLRLGTLFVKSIWSVSLLCLMGPALEAGCPAQMNEDLRGRIGGAIGGAVLTGFPPHPQDERAVYAFHGTALASAEAWHRHVQTGQDGEVYSALASGVRDIIEPQKMLDALRELPTHPPQYQATLTHFVRVLAHTREIPVEPFWNLFADLAWREKVLLTVDSEALGLLADAVEEIRAWQGGQWISHIPHFYALACEAATDNSERQQLLFGLTVWSSLHFDSVSAVERLVKGRSGPALTAMAIAWRERFLELQPLSPSWIASRFGGILAVLHPATPAHSPAGKP
jgi:hypothetical protein